jgi:hypothetical protein
MDREIYTMHIGHTVLAKEPLIDLWKDLDEREQAKCKQMYGKQGIEYMYSSVLSFVIGIYVFFVYIFCNRKICISLYPLL